MQSSGARSGGQDVLKPVKRALNDMYCDFDGKNKKHRNRKDRFDHIRDDRKDHKHHTIEDC